MRRLVGGLIVGVIAAFLHVSYPITIVLILATFMVIGFIEG